MIDLGEGRNRLGASCLAQVYNQTGDETPDTPSPTLLKAFFNAIQQLNREGKLLAYHDRSDGGLFVTLLEMAFAGRTGLQIDLPEPCAAEDPLPHLFSEELGAVLQIRTHHLEACNRLPHPGRPLPPTPRPPHPRQRNHLHRRRENPSTPTTRTHLHKLWSETSFHIATLRDNPTSAAEEFALLDDPNRPGLTVQVPFDLTERVSAPFLSPPHTNPQQPGTRHQAPGTNPQQPGTRHQAPGTNTRPRIAILREQGVNGQNEMAYAFDRAGFTPVDVHMSDLLANRQSLSNFIGLAACGGFSYGDVLGAGSGWAKTILFNESLRTQFATFFARPDTFSLGICNGCQMMAQLAEIIPGAENWPRFERNLSTRFEARLCMTEIPPQTPSSSTTWQAPASPSS